MLKINKKGFTLLELMVYTSIAVIIGGVIFSSVVFAQKINRNTNLDLLAASNITNTNIYLDKALSNINNILLISHKDVNTKLGKDIIDEDFEVASNYLNQFEYNLVDIKNKCGFVTDDNYDLIAFSSKERLDPIIIGVIERTTESGRTYKQLAAYSYRKNKDVKEIRGDLALGNLTSYLDNNGRYVSAGLSDWKCNINNGFLIPISSKRYDDTINLIEDSSLTLNSFKVITEKELQNIKRYGVGYFEFQIVWEKKIKQNSINLFQTYSKTFNY